jgi:NAD(P)H-dependent FMN reductase
MPRIAIVTGSTRPGRHSLDVAQWVLGIAATRSDADYEILDIADFALPLLDEPVPPSLGRYSKPHTLKWAAAVAPCDGFVFVAPEYNHGMPGALKNALDFLFREWNDKAAAFVTYGSMGGVRAAENLRLVMGELKIADVRAQVMLTLRDDFEEMKTFKPREHHAKAVHAMLDELVRWAGALKTLRG